MNRESEFGHYPFGADSAVLLRPIAMLDLKAMRFVHLAPESSRRSIERSGLRGEKVSLPVGPAGERFALRQAVFCTPILADFWTTYQWLRELRRGPGQRLLAVHFRVPDDESMFVGRYGEPHLAVKASETAAWVQANPNGAQAILPRKVRQDEVHRLLEMNQLVGWTGCPESDKLFDCVCPACLPPGTPDLLRRFRGAYAKAVQALREATTPAEATAALLSMDMPLERARGRIPPTKILAQVDSPHATIRSCVAGLLGLFPWPQADKALAKLLQDADSRVCQQAVSSVWRLLRTQRAIDYLWEGPTRALLHFAETLLEFESNEAAQVSALEKLAQHPHRDIRAGASKLARTLYPQGSSEYHTRLQALSGEGGGGHS